MVGAQCSIALLADGPEDGLEERRKRKQQIYFRVGRRTEKVDGKHTDDVDVGA